jgi:major type 1 subunit fimbrin (pilin)
MKNAFALAAGVAVLFLSSPDIAWAQSCTPNAVKEETITMPTSIRYPRDTAVGTPLTGWMYSTTTASRQCTSQAAKPVSAMVDQGTLTKVSNLTVKNESGVSVSVWQTSLPGVGIAMTGRSRSCTLSGWGNVPKWQAGCTGTGALTIPLETQLGVRYVVTGRISPGSIEPQKVAKQLPTFDQVANYTEGYTMYYNLTKTTIEAPACVTPDVAVSLGKQQTGDFISAGSSTTPVSFSIKVNACDKDINTIKFSLTSALAQAALTGVVAATAESTSSGIGVKLMQPDGTAVPIDGSKLAVSGYDKTVGGNLTIPLKAAMYRISDTRPRGGTLKAEVQFTMYYE